MMNCLQNKTVSECVILLDYKMKFEPVYFREKTVDHYGKKGISWHGAMITFYTVVAVDGVRTAVQNRNYMDRVVENESKQDITSVISILEAVIIGLKKLFPRLTTIYLQSDNASCYQNTMLLLLIPYLAFTYILYAFSSISIPKPKTANLYWMLISQDAPKKCTNTAKKVINFIIIN